MATTPADLEYQGATGSTHHVSVRLPQHPGRALHNHGTQQGEKNYAPVKMVYAGFGNHPHYHVWRCEAKVPLPLVTQITERRFCTYRKHCGDQHARWVTLQKRYLCDHHARNYNRGRCTYSRTAMCVEAMGTNQGKPTHLQKTCNICNTIRQGKAA